MITSQFPAEMDWRTSDQMSSSAKSSCAPFRSRSRSCICRGSWASAHLDSRKALMSALRRTPENMYRTLRGLEAFPVSGERGANPDGSSGGVGETTCSAVPVGASGGFGETSCSVFSEGASGGFFPEGSTGGLDVNCTGEGGEISRGHAGCGDFSGSEGEEPGEAPASRPSCVTKG
jgi:hypothetical protein